MKTNVVNLIEIAQALRVPDAALLKYFCKELGANSEGTTVIKGIHQVSDLALHLDKFILKFVCCTKCKYPELSYHKQGKKQLIAKCFACHNE